MIFLCEREEFHHWEGIRWEGARGLESGSWEMGAGSWELVKLPTLVQPTKKQIVINAFVF